MKASALTLFGSVILLCVAVPGRGHAQINCVIIEDDAERLACYDAVVVLPDGDETALSERLVGERALWGNRYGILPHRRSYLLPLTYAAKPGRSTLRPEDGTDGEESLQRVEVKFQYSFKVPVGGGSFVVEGDELYFAFTQRSLWQAYNRDISSPFRETVYEPELIWSIPLRRALFGGRLSHFELGINHQSNGRGGPLSRSWNRVTFAATWADPDWAIGLRLWHRIEESEDEDDNPDIVDYLGYGELRVGYKWDQYRFTGVLRNNLRSNDNHTSVDLSFSWPLNDKLSGFVQFYNGYGETLVDYDNRLKRIGFGLILSDWF